MLFTTFTYAVFLGVVFALYLALPLRGRQLMLLAASYIFYCWEKPIYGTLLFASTILDYVCGRVLDATDKPGLRRLILVLSLSGNLGMLGFFKYGDFLGANFVGVGQLLGFHAHWKPMGIVLPVGISFYTFQTMSYVLQLYRRQTRATRDFVGFALYVCFFPQLVAGPIERATHLLPQLLTYQRVTLVDVAAGLQRIVIGLFRKLVLADRMAIIVDHVYANPTAHSTWMVWVGVMAFGTQIYCDFAGYADIAIGSARLLGIRLTENFKRPLSARSIGDFWTRWHITLTSWLRDYLFTPLGGFRKGGVRAMFNGAFVLLVCGLWHGASWHFVFWGGYHATLMILYYLWRTARKGLGFKSSERHLSPMVFASIVGTYLLTSLSCVFFRAPDMATVGVVFRALAGFSAGAHHATPWVVWVFAALILAVFSGDILQEHLRVSERIKQWPWPVRVAGLAVMAALIAIASVNSSTPYIYFQF